MNPTWRFELRGEGGQTLELDIFDIIGEGFWWRGVTARDVRARLQANKSAKTIKVRINSRGGDVVDGLAIYSLLNEASRKGARVEVDIDGLAASMASVIAMAGDEIRIAAGAFLMIHNPWGVGIGESDDLRSLADTLDKMRDNLVGIYAARSGQSAEQIRSMMDAETWMKADEAKSLGFVDSITPAKKKKEAARAIAQAFAALDPAAYQNLPAEIRSAIEAAQPKPPRAAEETEQETTMNLDLLRTMLGLGESATEADIFAALTRNQEALRSFLAVTGKTSAPEALGVIQGWRASADQLATVNAELAATKKATADREAAASIDEAVKAGRLAPASVPVAQDLYKNHGAAALAAFLGALPQVASVSTPTAPASGPTPAASSEPRLSSEEAQVAKQLGLSEEQASKNHGDFTKLGGRVA